jgi:hypothetical protein
MVTVEVIVLVVLLLVAVKAGMVGPEPLPAKPIAVLLLVQVKVVPETGPVMAVAGTDDPLQKF